MEIVLQPNRAERSARSVRGARHSRFQSDESKVESATLLQSLFLCDLACQWTEAGVENESFSPMTVALASG